MSIWFFGTPAFAERILRALLEDGRAVNLVVTQPDRPKGRGHKVRLSEVKACAQNETCSVYQPASLKAPEAREYLSEMARIEPPQIAVVAAYGQILPAWLLPVPKRGFLNVHASLLPRWRGASPIEHAIWSGDKETGVALMQVVRVLDAGPVFDAQHVAVAEDDDGATLTEKLAEVGASLLLKDLDKILAGELAATPQDEERVTYAPRLLKKHGVLDWTRPAEELERQVRAFHPWPGTYSRIRDKQVKVLAAAVVEEAGAPGQIVETGGRLVVACGSKALSLERLQLEGKNPLGAGEFLRGFSLTRGERFEQAPEPNPAPV